MFTNDDKIIKFQKPDISMKDLLEPLLMKYSDFSCEGSFVSLIMWCRCYNHKVAYEDNQVYIRVGTHCDNLFFLPFGEDIKTGVDRMIYTCNTICNKPATFLTSDGVRFEKFKELYGDRFEITPSRDAFEYIYKRTDLAELPGRKYHSKRNHISAFSKAYNWSYEPIDDTNLEEVLAMSEEWYRKRKEEDPENTLETEHEAISYILKHRDELNVIGGLIRVDGKVVAFTYGSPINNRVLDVHVEKALPEFREAYTVINREFAAHVPENYIYLNREDDMGLEGLRKAKLSYKPEILLEKYICRQKDFKI